MKFRDVFKEKIFNISNFLSLVRVILLPPFFYANYRYQKDPGREWLAFIGLIVFLAVVTDFFDGYLARKLNQITMLGKYLDPISDKIVTIGAMTVLLLYYSFPLWVFIYYIVREIVGVWGGTYLYFKRDIQGSPNQWGKWGVGVVAIMVIWYIVTPLVQLSFPADHIIVHPEYSAYLLAFVLTGGIVSYGRKYWNIVFRPAR